MITLFSSITPTFALELSLLTVPTLAIVSIKLPLRSLLGSSIEVGMVTFLRIFTFELVADKVTGEFELLLFVLILLVGEEIVAVDVGAVVVEATDSIVEVDEEVTPKVDVVDGVVDNVDAGTLEIVD